jgi:hypothetical protein
MTREGPWGVQPAGRPQDRGRRIPDRLPDRVSVGVLTGAFPGELVDEVIEKTGTRERRKRSLPAQLMVYYVLALALFAEQSYDEVMRLLTRGLGWLCGWSRTWEAPTVPAITKARTRLGEAPLALLFERVSGPLAAGPAEGTHWRGLRLTALDWATVSVPDTAENAASFGRAASAGKAASVGKKAPPQVRLAALGECGTGGLIGAAFGPLSQGTQHLARELLSALDSATLLVADWKFSSWELWREAASTGAHLVWQAGPSCALPVTDVLGDGTYLSQIEPPAGTSGEPVRVRAIDCEITASGEPPAVRPVTLITTMLDPVTAPAAELAALYQQRWKATTIFKSLKPHHRGRDVMLRSKSPDMARQEMWAMLCVYQGIRTLMWQSARGGGRSPDARPAAGAIRVIRHAAAARPGVPRCGQASRPASGARPASLPHASPVIAGAPSTRLTARR